VGEYAVLSAFAYVGAHDFTVGNNNWSMNGTTEVRDKTTFRNTGSRRWRATMFNTQLQMSGLSSVDPDGNDAFSFDRWKARLPQVATVGNIEGEGEPCCMTMSLVSQLQPGGGGVVGDLGQFSLTGQSSDPYGGVRGVLLAEQQAVSTTGAKGTAVQHGDVDADQHLFSTLHLLGTPGSSITAVIESDNASNFPSATTRITFGPLTASGGYWATPVAGAITDDWWRLRVTAVSGSWIVAAAIGIE
jgi:hypothetical protein